MMRNRDVDAGLVGDAVGAIRDPEFAIRRKNAERGAGCHARRISQSGRAQSHPDQHQVRRRRVEPHDRKSSHEVRSHLLCGPRVCVDGAGFERLNLNPYLDHDSMDLSWNYAAESQAYDRVHRLGQEKDVFVKRVVVENTIEERMLRLQDVKMGGP